MKLDFENQTGGLAIPWFVVNIGPSAKAKHPPPMLCPLNKDKVLPELPTILLDLF